MEGGAGRSIDEIRSMTLKQARVTLMSHKEAVQMASENMSADIRQYVEENKSGWTPISELKKMSRNEALERGGIDLGKS